MNLYPSAPETVRQLKSRWPEVTAREAEVRVVLQVCFSRFCQMHQKVRLQLPERSPDTREVRVRQGRRVPSRRQSSGRLEPRGAGGTREASAVRHALRTCTPASHGEAPGKGGPL